MTGVTCASATLPLLTQPPAREAGTRGARGGQQGGLLARPAMGALGGRATRGGVVGRGRIRGGGRSGSGSGSGAAARGYDIVVIDECSQIVEPLSLLPIAVAQPRRLVLVGDPMQLPPPVAYARVSGAWPNVKTRRDINNTAVVCARGKEAWGRDLELRVYLGRPVHISF